MTKKAPAAAWTIAKFDLYVDHSAVYANGKQQALVRAYIEAVDASGAPVRLTDVQKNSVRLISYDHPETTIPLPNDEDPAYRGWTSDSQYRGYEYHPRSGVLGKKADNRARPTAAGDTIELYLSATEAAVSAPLAVGFRVTGPDGKIYRSDGWILTPGVADYYNGNLNLKGDRKVLAEKVVPYASSEFVLDEFPNPTDDTSTGHTQAGIFDTAVTLSIVRGGTSPNVRDIHCTPAGMIHWGDNLPDTSNPCYVGYARPGSKDIAWNPLINVGSQPKPTLVRAIDGKGVFMLCGRVDIPRSSQVNPPLGPMSVELEDGYGNTQHCYLSFEEGKRDVLKFA